MLTQLMSEVERIADGLELEKSLVDQMLLDEFKEQLRRAKQNADEILNADRSVKLGIIGQVKAGKSTFLNALVFNGRAILPKAATPMTAALTKLVYSKEPFAKVVFYDRTDWSTVEAGAKHYDEEFARMHAELEEKYRADWKKLQFRKREITEADLKSIRNKIHPRYRACRELVDSAAPSIFSQLGREETISITNLKRDLENYVGASGLYTPLVKYLVLGIDNPLVEGLEIVDTPGLGDPIVSRSEKAREFIMQCDLVFLLSRTSQFLDRDDIELMARTLPGESVGRAILVGSQFDSVMLDDNSSGRPQFADVAMNTILKLNDAARERIDKSMNEFGVNGTALMQQLKLEFQSKKNPFDPPPYYTSALLYNAARNRLSGRALTEDEAYVLNQLSARFDGFDRNDPQCLLDCAGIDEIREDEFPSIRAEKDRIIREKSLKFAQDQTTAFLRRLDEIMSNAEQKLQSLKTGDVEEFNGELEQSRRALQSMRESVRITFERSASGAQKYMVDLANEMRRLTSNYQTIVVGDGSRMTKEEYEDSFLLFFKRTKHRDKLERFKTATVNDAIDNIDRYITSVETHVGKNLENAIDIGAISERVKRATAEALKKKIDANAADRVRLYIENELEKLTVPSFNLVDRTKYRTMIRNQFPDAFAEGLQIHALASAQGEVLRAAADDVVAELERKSEFIKSELERKAVTFIDKIGERIVADIDNLKLLIRNREESIAALEALVERLRQYKISLRRLEH